MKIVFFGTPTFIEPVIDALEKNFDLVKVFRAPQEIDTKTIEQSKILTPDFFVVAAFGKILSQELLNIPKIASINIHPSLLPKYRGSTPIQTAILNGDKSTGVTIIKMDEKVDHGPILDQFEEPILPNDTFESLAKKLFEKSSKELVQVLTHFDEIKPRVQDDSKASYTKLLTKQNGFIDLKNFELRTSNLELTRAVRAYYPWPGVWTKFRLTNSGDESVIKLLPNRRIQVEGKKPMSIKDFKNGYEKGSELIKMLGFTDKI